MDIDSETAKKIQELQILEQNLQNLLMQKQSFQIEANEILNALAETKKTNDEVYRIAGGIMLKANKADLIKELEEKNNIFGIRISSAEKQEKILAEKAEKLRKEVTAALSRKKS